MDTFSGTGLFAKTSNKYFESSHLKVISIYFDNVLKHTASANSPKRDSYYKYSFYSLDEIIKIDRGQEKTTKMMFQIT